MWPPSSTAPSLASTAGSRPARPRICERTLVACVGRWRTTSTAAGKSAGSAEIRWRSASTPPADAPIATAWTRALWSLIGTGPPFVLLDSIVRLNGDDVAVRSPLHVGRERQLVRAVDDDQPFRAGRLEGLDGFLLAEMPALGRLGLTQRRLAEEEGGVLRKLHEPMARPGVAGVGERSAVVLDPQPEGQLRVVVQPVRRDGEAPRLEGAVVLVLVDVEDGVDLAAEAHPLAVRGEALRPARREPQRGPRRVAPRPERPAEDPRHEI